MLRLNTNNQNLCLKDALTYWFPLVLDDDFDARMPHTKQEGGECGGGGDGGGKQCCFNGATLQGRVLNAGP